MIGVSWVRFMYSVVMCMHGSDCGSVHCCGCMVNGISAKTVLFIYKTDILSSQKLLCLEFRLQTPGFNI